MKNLKKVLALVLAFACAFTMFAGAAFTDAADVNSGNTDAVDMLSALGIIKGYDDGSFRPNATVTRAEMAKMIFTIRNGGNDNADAFKDGATSFQDVNGTWGAGYIKYCQSMGIIAGKSATRFAPDETVTGTEAAKMLLVTLGYDATNAGLIGSSWSSKTKALASEAGLLDGVTASLDAAFPRQFAAKIMSNALDANIVTYNADSKRYDKVETVGLEERVTGNGNTQWVSVTKNKTMGEQWMKLTTRESESVLTRISKESGRDTYAVTIGGTTYTRVAKDYAHLMGQKVKVMVKDNDTSKVFGIYADGDSKVIATVASGKIEEVTNNTGKVKVDGKEYDLGYKGTSYTINTDIVYEANTSVAATSTKKMMDADKTASTAATKAFSVKVIDNDGDGKIDRMVKTPVRVGQVTFVNSTSVNVSYKDGMGSATKTFKNADDTIYSGIAKEDWVVVTEKDNTSDDKNVLVKAEKITGDVSAVRDNEIKAGDTWYNTVKGLVSDNDVTIGKASDLIVVNGYVFNAEGSSVGDTNVLFVSDVDTEVTGSLGSNDGLLESKIYTSSSNSVVKVAKINGVKLVKDGVVPAIKDKMFTYSKNSSGNYELTELYAGTSTEGKGKGIAVNGKATDLIKNMAGYSTLNNNTTFSNKKIGGVTIADDAVVFVKANGTVKALSGKTVKNWNVSTFGQSGMSLMKTTNGINYVKVACLTDERVALPGGSADGKSYAFLTAKPTKAMYENETAVQLPLWDGESKTAYIDVTSVPSYLTDARLVVYEQDGKYVKVDEADMKMVVPVAITGFEEKDSEGAVTFIYGNGSAMQTYATNKDCVYIAVDGRDGVTGASREGMPTTDVNNGKYTANAWIYTDGDTIYAVAYDVDNELDTSVTFTK